MDTKAVTQKEGRYPEGIKWTRQRKDVYHVLLNAGEPLSAVQIYNRIEHQKEEAYAVSTVYRILSVFEEKGFVTKTTWLGDGTVLYELNTGTHTHYAICLKCHKKVALEACPIEQLHFHNSPEDFQVTGHKLELYGYCKACNKNHPV